MFTLDVTSRRFGPPAASLRRQAGLAFAATSLLLATACGGADVPTKPEAVAALGKAIEGKLARTLPSSRYCMTANPDFSFAGMGQIDLVATFQNLPEKSAEKNALYDAVTADVVRVEFKELRFDPAGQSPDPSCDALNGQLRQGGYRTDRLRYAVVWTTLTPKATASGVRFDTPIDIATRALVDITDIQRERGGSVAVKYTWTWQPTTMAGTIGYTPAAPQEATARLRRSDGGWLVESAGVK